MTHPHAHAVPGADPAPESSLGRLPEPAPERPPAHAHARAEAVVQAQSSLESARRAFTWAFLASVILITLLIVATITMMMIVSVGSSANLDKSLIARLLQIAFGMVISSVCVFLGVILTWFGVSASFAVSAEGGGSVKLALSSASPGIALIIGGLLITWATMSRPISYFEETGSVLQPSRPAAEQ